MSLCRLGVVQAIRGDWPHCLEKPILVFEVKKIPSAEISSRGLWQNNLQADCS